MTEKLAALISTIQNNQLVLLMFSGGIIWTVLSNVRSILGTIRNGIIECISFTVNSVSVTDYDVPILPLKIAKVLSDSKVLWERNSELVAASGEFGDSKMRNAAYGRSYRWILGHFMILDRTYSMESTKLTTTITARIFFARRKKFLKRLMDEIDKCNLKEDTDTVRVNMGKGICTEKPKRSINSIYTDGDVAQKLLADVKSFIANRELYIKSNSPYKFVALLTGTPGTGKTSAIHAIASELKMGVRFVNTDDETFEDIARIMVNSGELVEGEDTNRQIVVIEDVDCISLGANDKRKLEDVGEAKSSASSTRLPFELHESSLKVSTSTLSLSSILNLLDGIITPSGSIVFLTSNKPESLDAAFLRDGRIDSRYEFSNLSSDTANRMINDELGFIIEDIMDNVPPSSLQRDIMKVKINRMSKEDFVAKYTRK